MTEKRVIGVISGYFNPLGAHHLNYIKEAYLHLKTDSEKGTLLCIVNNDEQVKLKGSIPFQNLQERAAIVRSLGWIDGVVESIDTDRSVARSLEECAKRWDEYGELAYFYNGGDRTENNLNEKEVAVCKKLGCQIVTNIGGPKTGSSSNTLARYIINYQIQRLGVLKKNWDGQGASPIEPFLFDKAYGLVSLLDFTQKGTPRVLPTRSGNIFLEWPNGDSMEFTYQGFVIFFHAELEIEDTFNIDDTHAILAYFKEWAQRHA